MDSFACSFSSAALQMCSLVDAASGEWRRTARSRTQCLDDTNGTIGKVEENENEEREGRSTTAPPEQMSSIPMPPRRAPPALPSMSRLRSKLEMNERRTIIKFATHEITNARR